jgi:HAD superfamily hydrolase (TIGR01509 family)
MGYRAIFFDFGGVVAEEGFRDGLQEIAKKNGLAPDDFFSSADRLIGESRYLTGEASESDYWQTLRRDTGISGSDKALRREILSRFVLRQKVMECVDLLREKGFLVYMLSDQTNWLEEIDRETDLFSHFDGVYNSFRTHVSKRDERTFSTICDSLGIRTEEALFIDDNAGHIERAARSGLHTIHYTSLQDFIRKLERLTGIACSRSYGPGKF